MSLKPSVMRVRVLLLRVPLVVLVTEPSLSTFSNVPLTSQVILGLGEASTIQEKDTLPLATPATCVIGTSADGGTV